MNKQQTAAALQLVALLEGDLEAQANCTVYGNWLEHLTDHLADELAFIKQLIEDSSDRMTPKQRRRN